MKHIEVVGAIIEYNGKILCMQRGKSKYEYTSYKWEFPGGKVEEGESRPDALMRELREEMDFDININESDFLAKVDHEYRDFYITMYCYLCKTTSDSFNRKEHVDHMWLSPDKLNELDWAAADLPIVESVKEYYSKND